MRIIKRLFSTEHMVKEKDRLGEITPTKEAYKTSINIAAPAVAEMMSLAVMGMVGTAMVGRIGPHAVAAVGLTAQPRMIFMSLFFALNVGVTAIVSRRKGEGDRDAARLCLRQAMMVNVILGLIVSTLAVIFAGWVMNLAGAQYDTIEPASGFFRIVGMGFILSAMTLTICAAQRGVGNTRITMTVNLTANVVNVAVNFLLIEGRFGLPRLEVSGAAVAMVVGHAVGLVMALRSVINKDAYLRISRKDGWRPNISMLRNIANIGGNSIFEQIAMRVGFFTYTRVVAGLGTNAFAAHQIAMQLMHLSFTFADGIAVATTALVGQNLGKKRPDLSIMYFKIGQRFALTVALLLGALSITTRSVFPTLFTDYPEIIAAAATIILILGFIQPVQASQIVMAGSLRGAGDTRFVAITMLLTVALIRPTVSMLFVNVFQLGLAGAWASVSVDQLARLIMLYRRFTRGKWLNVKV